MADSIQGMENVVATVSGYHGTERFNLIKLLTNAGANYVGTMSPSITHLVCWKFEGKKYDLAKKFKTVIVNHRWFEECVKQGKRVPEKPYMSKSGQEVGPMLVEVPLISKDSKLNKKHTAFRANTVTYSDSIIYGKESKEDSDLAGWTGSLLLKENLFPESKENIGSSSHKSKPVRVKRTSKHDHQSSSINCLQEPALSAQLSSQKGKSAREKRSIHADDSHPNTSLGETSRKGRRLAKKNAYRDRIELDSDEECYIISPTKDHNIHAGTVTHSQGLKNIKDAGSTGIGQTSSRRTRNQVVEDSDEVEDWNLPPTLDGRNHHDVNARSAEGRAPQDSGSSRRTRNQVVEDSDEVEDWNLPPTLDVRNHHDVNARSAERRALQDSGSSRRTRNQVVEDSDEEEDWNLPPTLDVRNGHAVNGRSAERRALQDSGSDAENSDAKLEDMEPTMNISSLPPTVELSCVICWTEFSPTRGVLACGHRFCYSCIQNWADQLASRRKTSTCPLCKASFVSITKVEDAASSDQKIYSQTVPRPCSASDIFILPEQERLSFGFQSSLGTVCCKCRSREPEELLISCSRCQIRTIHSYCLDPYLLPWTCIHCQDLQMLYQHAC